MSMVVVPVNIIIIFIFIAIKTKSPVLVADILRIQRYNFYRCVSVVPRHPSVPARNLPPTARRLVLTKPTTICTYTHIRSFTSTPKSLVRVYWNVRDVTNVSTSVPLTFVMAIQNCSDVSDCPNPSKWNFFLRTVRDKLLSL